MSLRLNAERGIVRALWLDGVRLNIPNSFTFTRHYIGKAKVYAMHTRVARVDTSKYVKKKSLLLYFVVLGYSLLCNWV